VRVARPHFAQLEQRSREVPTEERRVRLTHTPHTHACTRPRARACPIPNARKRMHACRGCVQRRCTQRWRLEPRGSRRAARGTGRARSPLERTATATAALPAPRAPPAASSSTRSRGSRGGS
jgi:hypothetical protein